MNKEQQISELKERIAELEAAKEIAILEGRIKALELELQAIKSGMKGNFVSYPPVFHPNINPYTHPIVTNPVPTYPPGVRKPNFFKIDTGPTCDTLTCQTTGWVLQV